jgi:hypothetical protein
MQQEVAELKCHLSAEALYGNEEDCKPPNTTTSPSFQPTAIAKMELETTLNTLIRMSMTLNPIVSRRFVG